MKAPATLLRPSCHIDRRERDTKLCDALPAPLCNLLSLHFRLVSAVLGLWRVRSRRNDVNEDSQLRLPSDDSIDLGAGGPKEKKIGSKLIELGSTLQEIARNLLQFSIDVRRSQSFYQYLAARSHFIKGVKQRTSDHFPLELPLFFTVLNLMSALTNCQPVSDANCDAREERLRPRSPVAWRKAWPCRDESPADIRIHSDSPVSSIVEQGNYP